MSLACQKDSYCQNLTTKVVSCDSGQLTIIIDGKKQKLTGYEVILEDTILFPEGGGQPDDRGQINDINVLRVTRRGGHAVHFVQEQLAPGSEVVLKVDWDRRWDHMQQHSAQHLITALADRKYNFRTTSWNLGEKLSFIELDTMQLTRDQKSDLEHSVNEWIRNQVNVTTVLYESKDHPDLLKVRTRGLPDDHTGPVRIITIEGLDSNMCCGTHVSNLAHLQAVKLLSAEKGKKNKINLYFVAGDRMLKYLGEMYDREKILTGMLKSGPDQHVELLDKLQKSYKNVNKNALNLLRTLACVEAKLYLSQNPKQPYFSIHRKEGDNEYMNLVANEINDQNVIVFVTTGDDKGQGLFLLAGSESDIGVLGPKVAELVEGKGVMKGGRYQGKAKCLSKRPQAETVIEEYLKNRTEKRGATE